MLIASQAEFQIKLLSDRAKLLVINYPGKDERQLFLDFSNYFSLYWNLRSKHISSD
ncbi:MAG: hypothetical protein SAJ37_13795 [Oscillatoria sp. PMC 1068.18]|nr:hypothetical protein [Oscillatoria sp. PMC 1076.18]MEC4989799.1 hypothetical protein [Oscillatoria sp. PMC 1068.18]